MLPQMRESVADWKFYCSCTKWHAWILTRVSVQILMTEYVSVSLAIWQACAALSVLQEGPEKLRATPFVDLMHMFR